MIEPEITIRQALIEDLPAMTDIYNEVIMEGNYTADLNTFSVKDRKVWFDAHDQYPYHIFVLEIDQKILGYFYFSPWRAGREALKSVAEISFFLSKEVRGQGLGNMLMEKSLTIARELGFKHLLAILLDINSRSANLLEKWGFKVVGELSDVIKLPDMIVGQLIMLNKLAK